MLRKVNTGEHVCAIYDELKNDIDITIPTHENSEVLKFLAVHMAVALVCKKIKYLPLNNAHKYG